MTNLKLTTPRQSHLGENAAPAIASILVAANELRDACNAFGGTNDNRKEIEQWSEVITKRVADLLEVDDQDAVVKAGSIARHDQAYQFSISLAQIERTAPTIYSEEEGAKPLLKKFRRRIEDARLHLCEFESGKETREAIARDLDKVKELVAELVILDEQMDPWPAGRVTRYCESLLAALREPLRKEAVAPAETQAIHHEHILLSDEVDELILRLSHLGHPQHGGVEEVNAAMTKAKAIRQLAAGAIFSGNVHFHAITVQLQDLQSDLRRLGNIPSAVTGEPGFSPASHGYARKALAYVDQQMVKLLGMVAPSSAAAQPQPQSQTNALMSRISRAFAWGDSVDQYAQ